MEPLANFSDTVRRLKLTSVDVAALRDLGWSTVAVPEPSTAGLTLVAVLFCRRRRR